MKKPLYSIVPSVTPLPSQAAKAGASLRNGGEGKTAAAPAQGGSSPAPGPAAQPFLRAENEDDDGYDPYSDRPADPDPADAEDPWR